MQEKISDCLIKGCSELFSVDLKAVVLDRPEEQFGDYSLNLALQLSKELKHNPRDIAEKLAGYLRDNLKNELKDVSVAGPGFINITLNSYALLKQLDVRPMKSLNGKNIVIEYSDPNPFKILHVGHAYTTIVGDAVANLLEYAGASVHRVNYGGDVGLHVAKTIYEVINQLGGENPDKLNEVKPEQRSAWLSSAYVNGNNAYEAGDQAIKDEIAQLNRKIYELHAKEDHESNLAKIYWTCRDWSYKAFDAYYARLGTKIERYYPESQVADKGLELVKQNIPKVFQESDGAVIYDGDQKGLHTRVFINKLGLPTYEAKEVGLIVQKYDDYHYDQSIIITANEQAQYIAVVFQAMSEFMPELTKKSKYIPHGTVKMAGGVKMSSRKGNIIRADELIDLTTELNKKLVGHEDNDTTLGAIKYAFLKARLGGDLIYDPKESVSLEGNSGPYLQYAHARACSILAKIDLTTYELDENEELDKFERSLARKLSEYNEVIKRATSEYMPHHICTYIYELSQVFNRFYENSRVINDNRQNLRLHLVRQYASTLKAGLNLLGIEAPERL
jgi:arginyl-tRNA synthetase